MRYALILLCLAGCGDESVHPEPQPVNVTVNPTVVAPPVVVPPAVVQPVVVQPTVEVEKKPVKVIKVDLNKYEYKYSDDDEKPDRDVKDSKDKSEKKDG